MPPKLTCLLLLAGVAAFAAPLPLWGDDPANTSDGSRADRPAEEQADVAHELAALKQAIARLESKLDRLAEQPSEFSRVELRIVDEQGNALSGFEVKLTSSDSAQRAQASGVSNDDGIALTRQLPYGTYRMTVSGNGWYDRDILIVEVGKPLDLTIIAPTPGQVGELILKAELPRESVKGLRFGGWKFKHEDGWATRIAPEPREVREEVDEAPQEQADETPADGWNTFPTVSDGIEVVAVIVEFDIERRTKQPDGNQRMWEWRGNSNDEQRRHMRWLVQSDGTLRPLLSVTEGEIQIAGKAGRFGAVAPEEESEASEVESSSREKRLGYASLKLGEKHRGQAAIPLPAGKLQVSIDEILGRPSRDVLNAIDERAESSAGEVWLPAVIPRDSEWLERLLGEPRTTQTTRHPSARGFAKQVELEVSESQTVSIGTGQSDD